MSHRDLLTAAATRFSRLRERSHLRPLAGVLTMALLAPAVAACGSSPTTPPPPIVQPPPVIEPPAP
ncbi:MAG TPA: hypothetical protein VM364_11500, partial [Vicinamibacterales bacterium]|nr:hypothetical protein [Vicinamibacterales bacterium]